MKAYDAVQLAAATIAHKDRMSQRLPALTLVSADDELNAAAKAEGVKIENPNNYP